MLLPRRIVCPSTGRSSGHWLQTPATLLYSVHSPGGFEIWPVRVVSALVHGAVQPGSIERRTRIRSKVTRRWTGLGAGSQPTSTRLATTRRRPGAVETRTVTTAPFGAGTTFTAGAAAV